MLFACWRMTSYHGKEGKGGGRGGEGRGGKGRGGEGRGEERGRGRGRGKEIMTS